MERLLHQVLQSSRLLQVLSILRIDDLEQDLLNVGLVRLVLDDLTELNSVYLRRDQSLHLVEKILLLGEDRLESRRNLRAHKNGVGGFLRNSCLTIG